MSAASVGGYVDSLGEVSPALRDPCIRLLVAAVSDFEPVLQATASEEDDELDVFQAMSVFADFALEQLNTGNTEVAHRAFGAVDLLAGSDSRHLQLANALVAEFIEAVHGDTAAVAAMGPMTKARLASY